jgi:hypothetical protein
MPELGTSRKCKREDFMGLGLTEVLTVPEKYTIEIFFSTINFACIHTTVAGLLVVIRKWIMVENNVLLS